MGTSLEEEGQGSRQRPRERLGKQVDAGDEIFRITALQNRFDPSCDDSANMGYRDLALNIEVGWLSRDNVPFQKVRDRRRVNCMTHICEFKFGPGQLMSAQLKDTKNISNFVMGSRCSCN